MSPPESGSFGKPPSRPLLVLNAAQLLTLRGGPAIRCGRELGSLGLIEDGAVLIQDGKIQQIGPSARLQNLAIARQADVIRARNCVVMPAFVDCLHRPLVFRPSSHWFEPPVTTSASKIRHLNLGLAQAASAPTLTSMLGRQLRQRSRGGVGTMEARFGGDVGILRKCARAAHRTTGPGTYRVTLDFTAHAESTDGVLTTAHLKLLRSGIVQAGALAFTPHRPLPPQEAIMRTLFQHRIPIRMKSFGSTNSQELDLLLRYRALSLDEVGELPPKMADTFTESGVNFVIAPTTLGLPGGAKSIPPVRYLIERGAGIAIATSFEEGIHPIADQLMGLSLACLHYRVSAAEAIVAATINAAYILGVSDITGSLEYQKRADLIIFDTRDYRDLAYSLHGPRMLAAIFNGKPISAVESRPLPPGS